MSSPPRSDPKMQSSFTKESTLWGEMREEILPVHQRQREDEDEEENEDDESEDNSGEDEGSAESATSQEEERHVAAPRSTTSTRELPMEIESIIRTAYKPEGPKVVFPFKVPDITDCKEDEEVPYEYCRVNDIVHHTIRLNQHFRIMSALLHIAQNTKGTEFRKFPPIPDMIIRKRKVKRLRNFKFSVPVYQHPKPFLDKKTIQKMLQKSVVIILSQLGVDKATKSVVLVLVDVVKEYLRKMCLTCNTYCQWDLTKGHMDFRAVMHRTLVDMGLRNGQEDVKEYCENMMTRRNRAFRRTFHLVRLYLKTVHSARQKSRLVPMSATSRSSRVHNARTMLPQQGLSVYLPRGMQTITVMERGRPYLRKYQNVPTSAPAPMLASKFAALKHREQPPQLSAILRPAESMDQ